MTPPKEGESLNYLELAREAGRQPRGLYSPPMAVDHYENFPVASILLPRRLRVPVRDIYRFARTADDIADEGDALAEQRIAQLSQYRNALRQIRDDALSLHQADPLYPVFQPLAHTIRQHDLPMEPFFDLLSAFEQDVATTRYANDETLLDYCRHSADPVGRLMLHLYDQANAENLQQADAICTGLQLTNFWQDIAIDWQKGRVYLPQDKLNRYGVTEDYIAAQTHLGMQVVGQGSMPAGANGQLDLRWQALMREQAGQARELLQSGLPLAHRLGGRIGLELRLVVHGGLRILERLEQLHYNIFSQRPTLAKSDWALLLWRAIV